MIHCAIPSLRVKLAIMLSITASATLRFAATAWTSSPLIAHRFVGRSQLSGTGFIRSIQDSRLFSSFSPGDKIQVEIISFGPLGASVDVVAASHDEKDLIAPDAPVLGSGLVLQREIRYFRESRGNIDVVRGEILPAFVERVRETGKIDVTLRAYGGVAKADQLSQQIMETLKDSKILPIGDKSDPREIEKYFPGVSKTSFKRALSALYKQQRILVDKYSISLVER